MFERPPRLVSSFDVFKDQITQSESVELDDLQEIILKKQQRLNHREIINVYNEMQNKYYFKNLIQQISIVINNTCNITKYERNPLKRPFKITQTTNKPNEVFYIDIWTYPASINSLNLVIESN